MGMKAWGVGVFAVIGAMPGWLDVGGGAFIRSAEAAGVGQDDCRQGPGKRPCVVEIDVKVNDRCPDPDPAKHEWEVTPDPLVLAGNRGVTLVWKFKGPAGPPDKVWQFCTSRGHGIFFDKDATSTDNQFDEQMATDKENGDLPTVAGDCHRFYRMRNQNDPVTHGKSYPYSIRFGNGLGANCKIDPFIKNG